MGTHWSLLCLGLSSTPGAKVDGQAEEGAVCQGCNISDPCCLKFAMTLQTPTLA